MVKQISWISGENIRPCFTLNGKLIIFYWRLNWPRRMALAWIDPASSLRAEAALKNAIDAAPDHWLADHDLCQLGTTFMVEP